MSTDTSSTDSLNISSDSGEGWHHGESLHEEDKPYRDQETKYRAEILALKPVDESNVGAMLHYQETLKKKLRSARVDSESYKRGHLHWNDYWDVKIYVLEKILKDLIIKGHC